MTMIPRYLSNRVFKVRFFIEISVRILSSMSFAMAFSLRLNSGKSFAYTDVLLPVYTSVYL